MPYFLRKCIDLDLIIILQNGFKRILTKENKLYPVEISYLESVNYILAFHRDQFWGRCCSLSMLKIVSGMSI